MDRGDLIPEYRTLKRKDSFWLRVLEGSDHGLLVHVLRQAILAAGERESRGVEGTSLHGRQEQRKTESGVQVKPSKAHPKSLKVPSNLSKQCQQPGPAKART